MKKHFTTTLLILAAYFQLSAQGISQRVKDYCKSLTQYTADWHAAFVYNFFKYDSTGKEVAHEYEGLYSVFYKDATFYLNYHDQVTYYTNSIICCPDTCVGPYPYYARYFSYNKDGSIATDILIHDYGDTRDSLCTKYTYKDGKLTDNEVSGYSYLHNGTGAHATQYYYLYNPDGTLKQEKPRDSTDHK